MAVGGVFAFVLEAGGKHPPAGCVDRTVQPRLCRRPVGQECAGVFWIRFWCDLPDHVGGREFLQGNQVVVPDHAGAGLLDPIWRGLPSLSRIRFSFRLVHSRRAEPFTCLAPRPLRDEWIDVPNGEDPVHTGAPVCHRNGVYLSDRIKPGRIRTVEPMRPLTHLLDTADAQSCGLCDLTLRVPAAGGVVLSLSERARSMRRTAWAIVSKRLGAGAVASIGLLRRENKAITPKITQYTH